VPRPTSNEDQSSTAAKGAFQAAFTRRAPIDHPQIALSEDCRSAPRRFALTASGLRRYRESVAKLPVAYEPI